MKRIISVLKRLCPQALLDQTRIEFDRQIGAALDETFKEEMDIVEAGIKVSALWKHRLQGEWFETKFCAALDELAVASDAYINRNLNEKK